MEERKHIDRLYQEKFKDFEATPREAVWKNISTRLQEKERQRSILPVWYRIAGVAALLALFFNFASSLFKSSPSPDAQIVSTEQEENIWELNNTTSVYNESMIRSSIILQALMLDTKKTELEERMNMAARPEPRVISFSNVIRNNNAQRLSSSEISALNSAGVASQLQVQQNNTPVTRLRDLPLSNPDEDLFAEEISEKTLPSKRLRVSTVAAPIYYDNLGNGNSIDARFANNESAGEVSMAYGVNFAYQISEKVKIRSGVSKVDLSYNTRNIAFTAAVNPTILSGIDYKGEVPNYRIENRAARQFGNISASAEFNRASLASPATGYLNQRLGFIEVPVEIEYVIIDSKIGLNIIGGGSTLFLDENNISLNSADFSTNIGAANNLNNVSFTTNLGVGVDYKISPQFQVNLEPIFKYQLNTFNNGENINPYYFGIYSGFSFKF
ncbi:PorT family protein [Antarcticibacterium arcticum]|uniref:PorT family protein n=1 Tax=Antarcticibacterium arcticum TaxID=2585771 RepID=A0A5B8YKF4_9FLAO|nr:PorT family protein [Antarcticibacterium arcticum]QED38510.1 PorT family protein [Antarcticibacterium arcticum]